jgi:hypothetical protein
MKLGTYFAVNEGIWSPRDQVMGWRGWDTFPTEREARKAIRDILKDNPDAPLMLEQVTINEVWNNKRPEWDKSEEVKGESQSVDQ